MSDGISAGPVLVTGGAGQLSTAMTGAMARAGDFRALHRVGRPVFDFDRPETITDSFAAAAPSVVVNAAAWTAVDAAETEVEAARRANRDGPATLARLCAQTGVPLVHVSTDYVFDGSKGAPYVETDPTNPTGMYGLSKLEGEQAVLEACPQAIILRTSWVYSSTGKNFVRTMLGAAAKTSKLRVVGDQIGCPTTAADLADAIVAIIGRLRAGRTAAMQGIFHAAGTGWTSWHGLAVAAFEEAGKFGLAVPEVTAIATADWPTPTARPADSRLDCGKLADTFGVRLPEWRPSLNRTIAEIYQG